MKAKLLVIGFILTMFQATAFAQFFPAPAQVQVFPQQVAVQVFNPHMQPIICSGMAFGRTMNGMVFNAFFVEQFMPVGATRFAYVNAPYFSPFIHGWSEISCRMAFGW